MTPLGPEHPRQVGPYRLVRLLGEGSFGWVFQANPATPAEASDPVAMKLLKPSWAADLHVATRFERECASQKGLRHPHVVAALASGRDGGDGSPYLVMQLVEGPGLDAVLASGPVDPAFA